MNTMKWLLRREYWEHKGSFFWAPALVAILMTAVVAVTIGYGLVAHPADGTTTVMINGHSVTHTNAINQMGPEAKTMMANAVANGYIAAAAPLFGVLPFVVFFYCLSALYDDRRDRSILFWKSMPVSDVEMVLSKTAWAFVLAPVLALVIGLVLGMLLAVIAMIGTMFSGVDGASAMLTQAHPFKLVGVMLLALPVQMLWSLPAIGWLMLCSAWAKRLPFLWATIVPFLSAIMVSFTDVFPGIEIAHDKVWYTLVYRGLMSVMPGSWFPTVSDSIQNVHGPDDLARNVDLLVSWQVLGHADVWIGAVLGLAMIVAATRLRRWRDEG